MGDKIAQIQLLSNAKITSGSALQASWHMQGVVYQRSTLNLIRSTDVIPRRIIESLAKACA